MTITTLDGLVNALANSSSQVIVDKTGVAAAGGAYESLWRATGTPGQGAIPGAVAVCDNALLGSIPFAQQVNPVTSYLAQLNVSNGTAATNVELHDRLAHMAGLSGVLATAQTVGLDLSTLLGTSNLDLRKGAADYSEVRWRLEWYTATGSTAVTATVNVTYDDGTTGNLNAISLAATRPAGFVVFLSPYIPTGKAGSFIRAVNSVRLSATTGTAGSFGVTASVQLSAHPCLSANLLLQQDWAQLGLPQIQNDACLEILTLCASANTPTVKMIGKIAHG